MLEWLHGVCCRRPKSCPQLASTAKVGVIGGGIGGVTACRTLRANFGAQVEITLIEATDRIGGRCKTISLDDVRDEGSGGAGSTSGHKADGVTGEEERYEAGASIVSEMNKIFLGYMTELKLKKSERGLYSPMGVYDGADKRIWAYLGARGGCVPKTLFGCCWLPIRWVAWVADILDAISLLSKYGFRNLWKLKRIVKQKPRLDMGELYKALDNQECFSNPRDLARKLVPADCDYTEHLLSHTAREALFPAGKYDGAVLEDVVMPNMRCNYGGQGLDQLHGLVGLVSIIGGIGSSCFSVIGGNEKVIEGALKKASVDNHLVTTRCQKIVKTDAGKYDIVTDRYGTLSDFDAVILCVAQERNRRQTQLEFFPASISAKLSSDMPKYQRCVTTFVQGVLNEAYFAGKAGDMALGEKNPMKTSFYGKELPLLQVVTQKDNLPFYSVAAQWPTHLKNEKDSEAWLKKKLKETDGQLVYKLFSPALLKDEELDQIFSVRAPNKKVVEDWYAYPTYAVPQTFVPFVLEESGSSGLYYASPIEMVAGAMEMAAIGGKNAANLAFNFCKKNLQTAQAASGSRCSAKKDT